jgi:aminodeoxyfutalosine deaminase
VCPSASNSPCRVLRAPWVVPVTAPVLHDGGVVINQHSIVAVGSYGDISCRFPDIPVTDCPGVLLPALVNAHIHLDLSVYGPVPQESGESTMCDWISSLLKIRQEAGCSELEIQSAAETAAHRQYESGVGLMLDIGNSKLDDFDSCPVEIVPLLEMLGPSQAAECATIAAIEELSPKQAVTGHAPYSTTPELLRYIKKRSNAQNTLFSLHLAENPDESQLLAHGEGCFAQFLKDRGGFDSSFPIPGIDSSGVVGYLQQLGIMDEKTICVHCVHLTREEMKIIGSSQAHVCLCPGSNRFLSVGTAPLEEFLDLNILPALGTDSITSNPGLDMWDEMALLRNNHPSVSADTILAIATLGGAMALHREKDFGSLEKGRTSSILHVCGTKYENAANGRQLLDQLTSGGRPDSIDWLPAWK